MVKVARMVKISRCFATFAVNLEKNFDEVESDENGETIFRHFRKSENRKLFDEL
jgi:hypothetical protein